MRKRLSLVLAAVFTAAAAGYLFYSTGKIVNVIELESPIDAARVLAQIQRSEKRLQMVIPPAGGDVLLEVKKIADFIHSDTGRTYVAYVESDCYGGSVFIALACDKIIMAENAHLGRCVPHVSLQPLPPSDKIYSVIRQVIAIYSGNKYDKAITLGMTGETSEALETLFGEDNHISPINPVVLDAAGAAKYKISCATVKTFREALRLIETSPSGSAAE